MIICLYFACTCIPLFAEEKSSDTVSAPVETVVKKVEREERITLVGNLAADKEIRIDTQVPGVVTKVLADTGDKVEKGAVILEMENIDLERALISLKSAYDVQTLGFSMYQPYFLKQAGTDSNELTLALDRSRIDLKQKEKDLNRMKELFSKGSVTESEYDQVRTGFDLAVITFKQAEQTLKRQHLSIAVLKRDIGIVEKQVEMLKVKAPFTGKIVNVFYEVGEKIDSGPDANIAHFIDDSILVFSAGVPEEYFALIKKNGRLDLQLPGASEERTLKITRVSPSVDTAGRSFTVEADIDNRKGILKSGLFCKAFAVVTKAGLAIDPSFIIQEENGDFVKLKDGTLVRIMVTASPQPGEVFISGKGITEGVKLIK